MLQSRINVDWLTFDPQMFAPLFPRLKEGILRDVFIQKTVVTWDNAPSNRNRFGTHNREYSDASVHRTLGMIPCEASKGPSIGFTLDE